MFIKSIAMLGLLVSLSACGTFTSSRPTLDQMEHFDAGESAALIFNAQSDLDCNNYWPNFLNLSTAYADDDPEKFNKDAIKHGRIVTGGSKDEAPPGILIVDPGKYMLSSMSCEYYTGGGLVFVDVPNVDKWFHTVDISAGEVVYFGTLDVRKVEVATKRSAVNRVLSGLVFSFGEGDDATYPVYDMRNTFDKTRGQISEEYPQLADKMEARLPITILSAEAVEQAYKTAYARDEDGKLPSAEVADAKFQEQLKMIAEASLAGIIEQVAPENGSPVELDPPTENTIG